MDKKIFEDIPSFKFDDKMFEKQEKARIDFVNKFPKEKLKDLKLDEYVKSGSKETICYILEYGDICLGVGGGSANKYGIYDSGEEGYKKNGEVIERVELETEFNKIKIFLIEMIELFDKGEYGKIDFSKSSVSRAILTKILYIYNPTKLIPIATYSQIKAVSEDLDINNVEYSEKNTLILNIKSMEKLRKTIEFNGWSSEKIGYYLWKKKEVSNKTQFYILGSKYGKKDVFTEMLDKSVISIGFNYEYDATKLYGKKINEIKNILKLELEDKKGIPQLAKFLTLKKGDRVAIKSNGSPKGKEGYLAIVGIVEVIEKDGKIYNYDPSGLGHTINVKFLKHDILKELSYGGYGQTIHLLNKKEHANKIINIFEEYRRISFEENSDIKESDEENVKNKSNKPLNQILFGPPGTGKTYNTIDKALEILDNDFYQENKNKREVLKEKVDYYKSNGQVEMVTFHQSYGYEEFVEGIKANTEDGHINYEVEDGIFKRIAKNSGTLEIENKILNFDFEKNRIFKMSLGGIYDPEIKEWCLKNDYISLGWGGDIDYSKLNNGENWNKFRGNVEKEFGEQIEGDKIKKTIQYMYYFKNYVKKGDLVVISEGNKKISSIAEVVGEYEYDSQKDIRYSHFKKVKWIVKDKEMNIETIYKKRLSQQTIYELNKDLIKEEALSNIISGKSVQKLKNYILIIDEINRGNISKVFGELITLIEDSKRIGNSEETKITLPYSGDEFGVPNNLYILGTMNTADRSIALLDTALRRRFDFEEMMPQPFIDKISKNIIDENGNETGIDVQKVLNKINERIEYLYDRDHTIGHAYFIGVKTKEELDNTMKNKIIPLLQEYFYDDWEKIQIVLGDYEKQKWNDRSIEDEDRFIIKKDKKIDNILGFSNYDEVDSIEDKYKVNYSEDRENEKEEFSINAYKKIYGGELIYNTTEEISLVDGSENEE